MSEPRHLSAIGWHGATAPVATAKSTLVEKPSTAFSPSWVPICSSSSSVRGSTDQVRTKVSPSRTVSGATPRSPQLAPGNGPFLWPRVHSRSGRNLSTRPAPALAAPSIPIDTCRSAGIPDVCVMARDQRYALVAWRSSAADWYGLGGVIGPGFGVASQEELVPNRTQVTYRCVGGWPLGSRGFGGDWYGFVCRPERCEVGRVEDVRRQPFGT